MAHQRFYYRIVYHLPRAVSSGVHELLEQIDRRDRCSVTW